MFLTLRQPLITMGGRPFHSLTKPNLYENFISKNAIQCICTLSAILFLISNANLYGHQYLQGKNTEEYTFHLQDTRVHGKVTDSDGNAIPGVNIIIKNTTRGALTDFDGNFEIQTKAGDILVFSYVGFISQEIRVPRDGEVIINVTLKEDTQQLGEVVVVGYGTQKKENLTGTVNTIKSDEITGKSSTSLANAIQGIAPGVTVISRPGDIGNDMGSINIRGRGNLGSSPPLFIVDGIPVSFNEFQRINPVDIESISVLKDAAASAIYGARAAFGVFVVTTKKGTEGKTSIDYNGYYGFQSPTVLPRKLGSYDFAMLTNEANINAGKNPVYSQEVLDIILAGNQPDLYPNNDWYKLVYQNSSPIFEHNVNISGGGKTRYYVSGTVYQQESLVKGRTLDRYSFRANTERQFTDNFKLGTNISLIRDDFERQGNFSVTDLDRMTPLTVAKHSDGTWGTVTAGIESGVLAENNPLRKMAEYGRSNYETTRFLASLNAEWEIINDLKISGVFSYNTYENKNSEFKNKVNRLIGFISKSPVSGTDVAVNNLTNTWQSSKTLMSQIYATYSKTFDIHDISLMLGTQFEDYRFEELSAGRNNYPSNSLNTINSGSGSAENLQNSGYPVERAFFSQFGRLNYAYDNRYLFEANIRFDQSSQFPKDSRLGIFPSFSAAWRVSQEKFMENTEWLSNLKLRASWGELGNVNNVGYYDYYDVLGVGSAYVSEGVLQDGSWPSIIANKNLTWETVVMTNFGLDAGFLNNKMNVQVDVFNKKTKDILLKLPLPFELGLNNDETTSTNAGIVSNKGIEAIISYINNDNTFKYGVSANISKIWNKIEDLRGLDNQISGVFINKVGESIGSFYGYKAEGLFIDATDVSSHVSQDAATAPGDIKYADVNTDGVFNADDRTILGNDVPYFTYGISFNASYHNFDLSVQGQGVNDVMVYLDGEASQAFFNGAGAKVYHLGRWTTQNPDPNATYPRVLPSADNGHNRRSSSFWLYDADYFRIKSIILGYTLPENIASSIKVESLRFYFSGTNLITVRADKRLKDFDPEMASARGTYPNLKTISFGINLSL